MNPQEVKQQADALLRSVARYDDRELTIDDLHMHLPDAARIAQAYIQAIDALEQLAFHQNDECYQFIIEDDLKRARDFLTGKEEE